MLELVSFGERTTPELFPAEVMTDEDEIGFCAYTKVVFYQEKPLSGELGGASR